MASKCNLYHTIIQQYMHCILRFARSFAEIILQILDHLSDSDNCKDSKSGLGFRIFEIPPCVHIYHRFDSSDRRRGQESFGVVNRDLHNGQRGLMFQGDRANTMKCFAHGNSKFTGSGRNFIVGLPAIDPPWINQSTVRGGKLETGLYSPCGKPIIICIAMSSYFHAEMEQNLRNDTLSGYVDRFNLSIKLP